MRFALADGRRWRERRREWVAAGTLILEDCFDGGEVAFGQFFDEGAGDDEAVGSCAGKVEEEGDVEFGPVVDDDVGVAFGRHEDAPVLIVDGGAGDGLFGGEGGVENDSSEENEMGFSSEVRGHGVVHKKWVKVRLAPLRWRGNLTLYHRGNSHKVTVFRNCRGCAHRICADCFNILAMSRMRRLRTVPGSCV